MTDHDALLNAVIADPHDDTARLVFADFIQEGGEPERAEFIRGQLELARTPDWEPFAVRWRRAAVEEQAGDRFRPSLPWADSWNPRFPFRRGFGYAVRTQAVGHLLEWGDQLFASAPLGELHLPGGDMDEYRAFAKQPWLPRVEVVNFWMNDRPTHPVRALATSPLTTSLRAIHFHNAISPGMSYLVEDLFESHLGGQLRELSFRVGDGSQLDLIEAFRSFHPTKLEKLTFDNMGLDIPATERLAATRVIRPIRELTFRNMNFNVGQVQTILTGLRNLQSLTLENIELRPRRARERAFPATAVQYFQKLRRLDLTRSHGFRDDLPSLLVKSLALLRSLRIGGLILESEFVRRLVNAPFWRNLVELDLSHNRLDDTAGQHLLAVAPPAELITLDLRGNRAFSPRVREQLRAHYPECLLDSSDAT